MLKGMRLEVRTMVQLSVVAILGIALMITFVSIRAHNLMKAEAFDKTREIASHYSQQINVQMADALSATRAVAKTFEAAVTNRDALDRRMFLKVLEKTVEASPFYFGVWVQFEPNKFDGKDEAFRDKDGFQADGGFMPYAKREGDTITIDASTGTYEEYKDKPYYRIPFDAKSECVITPYVEPDAGNVLMTSVCVPVMEGGSVIGVVGMDLVLTEMSATVSTIKPFDTGYAFLVANDGTFVGHPKTELAGKNITDFGGAPEILAAINRGEEIEQMTTAEQTGAQTYIKYVPIRIGNTTTPWSFAVAVPLDKVLAGARGIMWSTIGIGLAMLLVLLVAVYFVVRSIATPLHFAIAELSEGAGHVAAAAGHIAGSSQGMAQGASEQASSLEETSASLEEMASMTRQNAENATLANGLMKETDQVVSDGNKAVGQLSSAITEIKRSADETAKILKTIDGIAFQTNLLALNAAVEAARAGDAGKGFAVVAQEVRSLAQRSAEAARSTAELVEQSQKNADHGVAVTTKVTQAFGLIQESASTVGDIIAEIATACKEQSTGIDQINIAVSQIDQITQGNAANSEEAASASEELSAQARDLTGIVASLMSVVGGHAATEVANTPHIIGASHHKENMSVGVKAAPRPLPRNATFTLQRSDSNAHSVDTPRVENRVIRPEEVFPLDNDDVVNF